VVTDAPGRVFAIVGEILRRTELPVEPLVLRPETLQRRLREGHPLLSRVMGEAIRLDGEPVARSVFPIAPA
jgi:hypothetical protein